MRQRMKIKEKLQKQIDAQFKKEAKNVEEKFSTFDGFDPISSFKQGNIMLKKIPLIEPEVEDMKSIKSNFNPSTIQEWQCSFFPSLSSR